MGAFAFSFFQEKLNSMNNLTNSCVNVLADSLLANGDELDSNLPKFARSLHFFPHQASWHFY